MLEEIMSKQLNKTHTPVNIANMDIEEKENLLKQLLEDLNYQHPRKKLDKRFLYDYIQLCELVGNDDIEWAKIEEGADATYRAKWLRNAILDKELFRICDKLALRKAFSCMDYAGKFWCAKLIKEEHSLTWDKFVERYKIRFFPVNYKSRIRNKLAALKQRTDETVECLMSIIEIMFNELDISDPTEIEDVFIRALREPIRMDVRLYKVQYPKASLVQLKSYAKDREVLNYRSTDYDRSQQTLFRRNDDAHELANSRPFRGKRWSQGNRFTNKSENNRATDQGTRITTAKYPRTFRDAEVIQANTLNRTRASPEDKNPMILAF